MTGKGRELNILWLWPDILSQHGDRGNVMALVRICGLYGIEARVTRVNRLTDKFDLDKADMAILGAGELSVVPRIVGALSGEKFMDLKAWTKSGGVLFATGTTGAALGVQTFRLDGSFIFGTGLLDMECRERKEVLGDDLIYQTSDNNYVYGIQIHMIDIDLAPVQKPFGETVYGYGNNGGKAEGAIQDNVIFTNALGPVLVKNPWLTLDLINRALAGHDNDGFSDLHPSLFKAGPGGALSFDPNLFKLELESAEAIRIFNDKKEKPK